MKIHTLALQNFRNHTLTHIECSEHLNLFVGGNGEGKTSILESISYLCLTKSFLSSSDETIVQYGKSSFSVEGRAERDGSVSYKIIALYNNDAHEKTISINNIILKKASEIVGRFPVVASSPEMISITMGGPAERRSFLDFVICQSSKLYLENLIEYRRILKQRNRILFDEKQKGTRNRELIEPWNEALAVSGATLILRRRDFLIEFKPHVVHAYNRIAGKEEKPSLTYLPSVTGIETESQKVMQEQILRQLEVASAREYKLGLTLVGPHRDDVEFAINEKPMRKFASQGQHKTLLVALKIAEFYFLQEKCREAPILLLDDVFSELDPQRSYRLLEVVESLGQSFITSTTDSFLNNHFDGKNHNKRIVVSGGSVGKVCSDVAH
ncbi:MAG: DNA replication/repair protein RecF [bacterium]